MTASRRRRSDERPRRRPRGSRAPRRRGCTRWPLSLDEHFRRAVDLLAGASGRVVVSGMGKSGHVARKIAATLASTGTPALFVHPAEASHGDLGMIVPGDAVLALSNSGETAELADLVAHAAPLRPAAGRDHRARRQRRWPPPPTSR